MTTPFQPSSYSIMLHKILDLPYWLPTGTKISLDSPREEIQSAVSAVNNAEHARQLIQDKTSIKQDTQATAPESMSVLPRSAKASTEASASQPITTHTGNTEDTDTVSFTLLTAKLNANTVLLAEISHTDTSAERAQQQLLQNILSACQQQLGAPVKNSYTLRWPLPQVPADRTHAKETLSGLLAGHRQQGVTHFLLSMDSLVSLLTEQTMTPYVPMTHPAGHLVLIDSLPKLLKQPNQKKALWAWLKSHLNQYHAVLNP